MIKPGEPADASERLVQFRHIAWRFLRPVYLLPLYFASTSLILISQLKFTDTELLPLHPQMLLLTSRLEPSTSQSDIYSRLDGFSLIAAAPPTINFRARSRQPPLIVF